MALYATPDPRVPAWLYSCDGLFAGALQPRGQLSSSVWRQHAPPSGQAERGESLEGWECEVVFITGASTCFPQHWLHLSQQLQVPSGTPALHQHLNCGLFGKGMYMETEHGATALELKYCSFSDAGDGPSMNMYREFRKAGDIGVIC